jgi:hypothetical protein
MLLGVLLFGIAGLMHPLLVGDSAAQLGTIAHGRMARDSLVTAVWSGVHVCGVDRGIAAPNDYAGHLRRARRSDGRLHLSVWSLNIPFMVGAGWQLAALTHIGSWNDRDARRLHGTTCCTPWDWPPSVSRRSCWGSWPTCLDGRFATVVSAAGWLAGCVGRGPFTGATALVFASFRGFYSSRRVFVTWLAARSADAAERRQPD